MLWHDVKAVLGSEAVSVATQQDKDWESPLQFGTELELTVNGLTSTGQWIHPIRIEALTRNSCVGDSISVHSTPEGPWAVIVPLALPGEKIRAKIYRSSRLHSFGDLVEVLEPNSSMRDSSLIRCKYFGKCAGCQHQVSLASDAHLIDSEISALDGSLCHAITDERGNRTQSVSELFGQVNHAHRYLGGNLRA